jgi:hypothetical protein
MPTDLDTAAEPAAGVAAPIDDGQATAAPAFEHWLPLVGPDDRDDEEDDAEASVPATTDLDPVPVVPALETWLPLLEDRSQNPEVCPFFRAVVADGRLGPPIESTHPANRCAALRQAAPQSLRQQQLVCLTSGHINCPRYLRGALVMSEPALAPARPRSGPTPATLSALVALVLAFSASVAFVLAKGGLTLQPVDRALGHAHRDPERHADAHGNRRGVADAAAHLEPVRAPHGLSEQASLLDLHRPQRRQPVQYRPLLRGAAEHGPTAQSVDADPGIARRQAAGPPAADALVTPGGSRRPGRSIKSA